MKIASWNVDSVRVRLSHIVDWVDHVEPDVICLQETKVAARSFPRSPFVDRGYEIACTDVGGQGGVAMVSRVGLGDPVVGIPGARSPLNEQRSISATCSGVRIHTVYAPNGRKVGTRHHEIKMAWFRLLEAWLALDGLDTDQPTVLIGDLNIAPTDLDVWDASRYRRRNLTSPVERQAFQRLLDLGLVDAFRIEHPESQLFTWWNRRGDFFFTDRGWRLDHVLVDCETARRVVSVSIDRGERGRERASDHAPLLLQLASTFDDG